MRGRIVNSLAGLLMLGLSTASFAMQGLMDMEGNAADFDARLGNGKWQVVMIWAHDCPVCNREVHQYEELSFRGEDLNLEVVGISLDGRQGLADAQDFVRRHQLTFDNYVGEAIDVARQYLERTGQRLSGTPGFMIYGPDGTLRARQLGAVPVEIIERFVSSG